MVRNISRHDFEGMKKKLLIANNTDTSSADQSNQGKASDSDCDNSKDSDSETVWPNTGDMNEFPELTDVSKIKLT